MKIQTLVQANLGTPFYTLQNGELFQFIVFDENYKITIQYIYKASPILMKIDRIGAIDYPYDKEAEKSVLYINEMALVQTIKKTEQIYKDYSKDQEIFLESFNKYYIYGNE